MLYQHPISSNVENMRSTIANAYKGLPFPTGIKQSLTNTFAFLGCSPALLCHPHDSANNGEDEDRVVAYVTRW